MLFEKLQNIINEFDDKCQVLPHISKIHIDTIKFRFAEARRLLEQLATVEKEHIFENIDDEIIKKWWTSRKNKKDDLVLSISMNSKQIHLVVEDKYYIRCDYLHQLQNVYYCLTGKELQPVSTK